jgi:hypothetical protein
MPRKYLINTRFDILNSFIIALQPYLYLFLFILDYQYRDNLLESLLPFSSHRVMVQIDFFQIHFDENTYQFCYSMLLVPVLIHKEIYKVCKLFLLFFLIHIIRVAQHRLLPAILH